MTFFSQGHGEGGQSWAPASVSCTQHGEDARELTERTGVRVSRSPQTAQKSGRVECASPCI